MKGKPLKIPEVMVIAATRVVLGVGLGLLIADHLDWHGRRKAGWTLFIGGLASTLPLMVTVLTRPRASTTESVEE
jgi:predicted MFS family arabinose efflux permease